MEEPGPRPPHRPHKGFWARFSEQETGPQKVLVGLAGTMTALATTVGGIYAVTNLVDHDDPATVATDSTGTPDDSTSGSTDGSTGGAPEPSTTPNVSAEPTTDIPLEPGQTLVAQGSKEADALVHALVDDAGARAELNVVVLAESRDKTPQWIMRLWYNCQGLPEGQPPGQDLCDSAMLVFDDASPSPTLFRRPLRIELNGVWADNRPSGEGYGAQGLEIYPVPASF